LDARLETRVKEVLHEKKGEITKSLPYTKMNEKYARDDNRHPLSPCELGNPSRSVERSSVLKEPLNVEGLPRPRSGAKKGSGANSDFAPKQPREKL
jgi:hypothetical protein